MHLQLCYSCTVYTCACDTDAIRVKATLWTPKLTYNILAILPGVGMPTQTSPSVVIAHMGPAVVAGWVATGPHILCQVCMQRHQGCNYTPQEYTYVYTYMHVCVPQQHTCFTVRPTVPLWTHTVTIEWLTAVTIFHTKATVHALPCTCKEHQSQMY